MPDADAGSRGDKDISAVNRDFYDRLWRQSRLIAPELFNTWPVVEELCAHAPTRLEIAPGLRPRMPLANTRFLDISQVAVAVLKAHGAQALAGSITAMPFADGKFACVCALDIVEHVKDDESAFSELARVSADGATLLLSVPLYSDAWTAFDGFVGHFRRYEPEDLLAKLHRHGFTLERSAVYGMQVQSSWLLGLGVWFMMHWRSHAMSWYNRVLMPIGLRRQKPLCFHAGLIDERDVDTLLLVCRMANDRPPEKGVGA